MAKKLYVLDTNVLLDDTKIFEKLGGKDTDIVIPFVVLEELDKHKTAKGELGANARSVIRFLDGVSKEGDLFKGIALPCEAKLSVRNWDAACQAVLTEQSMVDMPDNRILATVVVCKNETKLLKGKAKVEVSLLSNDLSLRLKTKAFGLEAEGHKKSNRDADDEYAGLIEVLVDGKDVDAFYANGFIRQYEGWDLYMNEYVHMVSNIRSSHTAVGRFDGKNIVKIDMPKEVFGIKGRNVEQTCAINAILDPEITLVSLQGPAGTGKSLIVLASALELTLHKKLFDKIIFIKESTVLGNNLGFLPGSVDEKMSHAFASAFDSFDVLFKTTGEKTKEMVDHLVENGYIELSPPTYFRGRSLPRTLCIFEESQNSDPKTMKAIASRLGEGSKLIIMGDPSQVDDDRLDSVNNGLVAISNAFKGQRCAVSLHLKNCIRSEFAGLVADLM